MFELILVITVLALLAGLIIVVVSVLRRRFHRAIQILKLCGGGLTLYLGIVVAVSLAAPQRVVALGEDWCFDDWCVTIDGASTAREIGQGQRTAQAGGTFYIITLRISNRAHGRAQRASSAAVHLIDDQGRWYDLSAEGQAAFAAVHGPLEPLTATLAVGQSIATTQVFELPPNTHPVALTIEHPVGLGPGLLVIGDAASLLHRPTIVRLP